MEYQEMVYKITHGFVIQRFDNNKFVSQEFVAGDQVEYETPNGEQVEEVSDDLPYVPFEMVQPITEEIQLNELMQKLQVNEVRVVCNNSLTDSESKLLRIRHHKRQTEVLDQDNSKFSKKKINKSE